MITFIATMLPYFLLESWCLRSCRIYIISNIIVFFLIVTCDFGIICSVAVATVVLSIPLLMLFLLSQSDNINHYVYQHREIHEKLFISLRVVFLLSLLLPV